jgi:glycosyltransferase involved in cell wall biosynthesis
MNENAIESILNHSLNNFTPILVSIAVITYNHKYFIVEAIESILMQKTTFPVEILIHDDASTDGTKEIIEEYTSKYPHLFFPIYQKENQYSKGIKPFFNLFIQKPVANT